MNHAGAGAWRAYSAGSKPAGTPNPFALKTLTAHSIAVGADDTAPRSKSWDEFAGDDAPIMDVVVTVCDNAASETCPVWPTQGARPPKTMHWGFPDPAAAEGSDEDKRAAFETVFADIRQSIDAFLENEK